MNRKKIWENWKWLPMILAGCGIFALGFDLFLEPHSINCGGLSGLAQVVLELLGRIFPQAELEQVLSVGRLTAIMNVPLFILGGTKIGKRFFVGSLVGMLAMSGCLDLFGSIPVPATEPLLGALYGGLVTGFGMGLVFLSGMSSGGTDIIVRLVRMRNRNMPIGKIGMCLDGIVVALTGIVFRDMSKALYCGVTLYLCSKLVDAVVYHFDYSKVALIITGKYEEMTQAIGKRLDRGATYLYAQGSFSHRDTKVVLTAIKRQQFAELVELVDQVDSDAFVIVQEAHQVLGDGFARYSKDAL